MTFTVAANALQRDVLLPALLRRVHEHAPGLDLRIIPSGVPTTAMLRGDQVHLVPSPRPPEGDDILRLQLFTDHYRVFHDPEVRAAPAGLEGYLAAEHATVAYDDTARLAFDEEVEARGIRRRFRVYVPGFDSLAVFVRGTPLVATAPGLLARTALAGLAHAPLPFPAAPLPVHMAWHARHRNDPAHRWVRRGYDHRPRRPALSGPGQGDSTASHPVRVTKDRAVEASSPARRAARGRTAGPAPGRS